ncbi:hypothetical protein [Nocardioides sp. WS12]|uniref:FitA-like ribbon-helix-helix domain-containing protein n=1 Tax=Nocardioides sp. WS12 TaxID=2486272 RepID=UPI00191D3E8D|nr:hypothetical protein [Nocardioides sp. WS12]
MSDETYRALKARAAAHGRSVEAEVRQILDAAVAEQTDLGIGGRMVQIAAAVGGFDLGVERDGTASRPVGLG